MYYLSPLRYPGGKGTLAPFLGRVLESQTSKYVTYVEPFAGGAGAALRLMYDEYVERIVLNDLNPGIAAFWRSLFYHTTEFSRLVEKCPVTIAEWHRQRQTYLSQDANDDIALGFATLFLNRTNRSGILNARPIGGVKQEGRWKMGARFNHADLVKRIETLARYRNRVTILEEDGVDIIGSFLSRKSKSFAYVDPPYLAQGSDLYLDTLSWPDHERLARTLNASDSGWLVTYDEDRRVPTELYPDRRCVAFDFAHTAAVQHVGWEYAVFSDGLRLWSMDGLGRHQAILGPGW